CADAGQHQAVGSADDGGVRGDLDPPAHALERALGRAEVARPVVEHGDALHAGYSTPFVDGTPCTRGSSSTAARTARATALYCASVMWCQSRPLCTMTCNAIAAWWTNDSKTCRVSVVA